MEGLLINPVVYVLKCEQDKIYVGMTMNLNLRIAQHWSGQGAQWTKRYKPLELIQVIAFGSKSLENKVTLLYMKEWGAENVRGGSYVQANVSSATCKLVDKTTDE